MNSRRPSTNAELLEREAELAEIDALLERVQKGNGGLVVVESPAGSGKTALLATATERARRREIHVLEARGGELERDFAFGIARQLFERVARHASEERTREILDGPAQHTARILGVKPPDLPDAESPQAVVHGLYWVVLNLCASEPLLLVIDDVQWADSPSWDWLRYVGRRTGGAAFGLLLAGRSETFAESEHRATEMAQLADGRLVALEPLSEHGVGELIKAKAGETPDPTFSRACHEVTQGNPFFVAELQHEIAARQIRPTAENVKALERLAPDRIGWSVAARLNRLGEEPRLVAEVLAVFNRASLSEIHNLAEMDVAETTRALDLLIAHELVEQEVQFRFVHSVVRRAIYEDLAPARKVVMHHAAAQLIANTGGSAERVASHLLNVAPDADAWLARRLLLAAQQARAEKAFSTVVSYLTRALAEHVPGPLRVPILSELGLAEEKLRLPNSIEHLSQAIELTYDAARRAKLVQALGRALAYEGRVDDGVQMLEREVDRLGPEARELAWDLEMEIQAFGRTASETVERTLQRLARLVEQTQHDPPPDRRVDYVLTQRPCWDGTDWRQSERRVAESLRARPNPFADDPEWLGQYFTLQALGWCDLYGRALEQLDLAFEAAALQGSMTAHVLASTYRAEVHLRRGAYAAAEADARAAVELIDEHRLEVPAALAFAWLVAALVERGRSDDAREVLRERGFDQAIPDQNVFAMLYGARAQLHLAGRAFVVALEDALHSGELLSAIGPGPTPWPWRATAAMSAHALGEHERAQQIAHEDLELARSFGAPRALGIALRTIALVSPGDPLPRLRESVVVLERSEVRGELAQSLVELGSAMRRRRSPASETRPLLQQALDLAHRCGSKLLEQRARDELIAAGGRPRRASIRGSEALTPRELRVAQLAAEGSTNRQIAQILFISPRTVEHHLGSVYRKLEIRSREQLGVALENPAVELTAVIRSLVKPA
jgi:DNA-binding CsgD family transcriptional regulator